AKHCRSRDAWGDLLKQFRPLSAQTVFELQETCGVTTRAGKTFDKPGADRIGDICEHDRDGSGRLEQFLHTGAAGGHRDVRAEGDKFSSVLAQVLGVEATPTVVDLHVAAVNPTQLLQGLQKRRKGGLTLRIIRSQPEKYADTAHSVDLLSAHRERRRGCYATGNRKDELAPSHCLPRGSALGIVSAQSSVLEGAMSALGQKQTCAVQRLMSPLPLIATAKADSRKKSCPLCP